MVAYLVMFQFHLITQKHATFNTWLEHVLKDQINGHKSSSQWMEEHRSLNTWVNFCVVQVVERRNEQSI